MENLVVINIPIYKSEVDGVELASLLNCIKVLKNYPIVFLAPQSLDIQFYQFICAGLVDFKVETFDDKYFANINGYNKLMLKRDYYKKFKPYQFILIFQLDAWVFKDELTYWCKQDYDYIGAPWYEGYTYANNYSPFIGVGNGGFSLRKISAHLKALNRFSYLYPPTGFMANLSLYKKFNPKNLCKLLLNLTIKNNTFYLFNDFQKNEDYFWCTFVNQNFKWFSIPTENIAAQFAFEKKAALLYERNQNQLPFGCHGWYKYEKEFWKQHIDF